MIDFIFWISFFFIIYTYLIYPFLVFVLAKYFKKEVQKSNYEPSVSVIMSVYNEEKNISRKIENLLLLDYPGEKIEILIGSDGSDDLTNDLIKNISSNAIRFYYNEEPRGKVSMLGRLVPQATGDIIVFTDARQRIPKDAIRKIVKYFSDETIGSVSAELIMSGDKKGSVAEGINIYWKYEKFIREHESLFGSMLGATGALYAIRKRLFKPLDRDILLDDMLIPLQTIRQGFRAIFAPEIEVYDQVIQDIKRENARKIRTLCGNWQLLFRYPSFFIPFKSPIGFQLISHKILRLFIPWFLIIIFVLNPFLIRMHDIYLITFILQSVFYTLAILGHFLNKYHFRIFNIPFTFCAMNMAAFKSFFVYMLDKQQVTWKK